MKAEVQDGLEFMQRSETHWKVRVLPVHLPGKFCLFPQLKLRLNGQITGSSLVLRKLKFRLETLLSGHRVPWEPHGSPAPASILKVILELAVGRLIWL